jgi:hypothetical protein
MTAKKQSLQLIDRQTMSFPDRRFWGVTVSNSRSELKYMYAIGLWDLEELSALQIPGADPANRGTPWYQFPTPPREYEITEDAATHIVPTQEGGKFIESHGNLFKNIRIGGTVGLRPNPVNTEVVPGLSGATGISLSIPGDDLFFNDERGLPPGEATGLDDITFLRNIFRAYFDLKKSHEFARKTVMVWLYAKESEWYVVEPISFTTSRSSANPLSWNYQISLRTIYRFDQTLRLRKDSLGFFGSIAALSGILDRAVNDLVSALNGIADAVDFVASLPFELASTFISKVTSVVNSLANLRNTGKRLTEIGKRGLRQIKQAAEEFNEAATLLVRGEISGNKQVFGSTVTSNVPSATTASEKAVHRNQAIRAAKLVIRTMDRLLATDSLFTQSKQVAIDDYSRRYKDEAGLLPQTVSPLDPNNITLPSAVVERDVHVDEGIRGMAKRYLGDESQWKVLAILNDLKAPYVSATGGDNLLGPGDKILVPKRADANDLTNVSKENEDSPSTLSPVLKKYGRDLRTTTSSVSTELLDIQVSPSGDLSLIEGTPNVSQAMMLKFGTEQGALPLHPDYGASYPLGTKINLGRIQDFALTVRRTVLSDDRIDRIDELRLFTEGSDALRVKVRAKLKQSDAKLPIEFLVRR